MRPNVQMKASIITLLVLSPLKIGIGTQLKKIRITKSISVHICKTMLQKTNNYRPRCSEMGVPQTLFLILIAIFFNSKNFGNIFFNFDRYRTGGRSKTSGYLTTKMSGQLTTRSAPK